MEIKVTPVFKALWETQARINAVRGGTRSSKSYSITQIAVLWLFTGYIGKQHITKGTFSIVRATFPALRATVYKDFINLLDEYGFNRHVEHRKSTNEFRYQGREVLFFSTDDEQKLKGRQNTFYWINEADSVLYENFTQLIIRNTHWGYLDYNPQGDPWVKNKIEIERAKSHGDVFLHVSTYKDNPFLPAPMIDEILALKKTNLDLYKIFTLGQWVRRSGLIFPKVQKFDKWPDAPGSVYWGLDFGFIVDPSALVEVRIYETKKEIYIKELLYSKGLLLTDIAAAIFANNCGRVICDGSDPRSIDELRRRGCRVQGSFKGAGSIVQGINRILQYKIFISGENALKEFKNYHWKQNTGGELLPVPEDKSNHIADAVRYSISYSMRAKIQLI